MSETPPPGEQPPPISPRPPEQRSGCLTAFLVIIGIVLLLPGLCALTFGLPALKSSLSAGTVLVVLVGLAIGFAGVMLIWNAIGGSHS